MTDLLLTWPKTPAECQHVDSKGVLHKGLLGTLWCGEQRFHALKRVGYVELADGVYEVEMDHFDSGIRVLRVVGALDSHAQTQKQAATLAKHSQAIHVANYPEQLEGCIAPGLDRTPSGVGSSHVAFERIVALLGGWVPGKKCTLEVRSLATGALS